MAGGVIGSLYGAARLVLPLVGLLGMVLLFRAHPDLLDVFGPEPGGRVLAVAVLIVLFVLILAVGVRVLRADIALTGVTPLDRLLGALVGLVLAALLVGGTVRGLETVGGSPAKLLFAGSGLAVTAREFFLRTVMPLVPVLVPV